jgi:hypothetical protein
MDNSSLVDFTENKKNSECDGGSIKELKDAKYIRAVLE